MEYLNLAGFLVVELGFSTGWIYLLCHFYLWLWERPGSFLKQVLTTAVWGSCRGSTLAVQYSLSPTVSVRHLPRRWRPQSLDFWPLRRAVLDRPGRRAPGRDLPRRVLVVGEKQRPEAVLTNEGRKRSITNFARPGSRGTIAAPRPFSF